MASVGCEHAAKNGRGELNGKVSPLRVSYESPESRRVAKSGPVPSRAGEAKKIFFGLGWNSVKIIL